MAAIINERDKFLQAQSVRINRVPIEIGDVNGLQDALNAVKNITVTASANAFIRNISNPTGPTSPTSITLTANLNGLTGTVSWSVVSGTLTISPSGNNCTITGANMTSYTAVIRAQLYADGRYYQADTVINRLGAAAGNDKIPPDALTAGTLAAGVIYAGQINADNITTGTLVGRSIKTAITGGRLEIEPGNPPELKVYEQDASSAADYAVRIAVGTGPQVIWARSTKGSHAIRASQVSPLFPLAALLAESTTAAECIYAYATGAGQGLRIVSTGAGSGITIDARSGPDLVFTPRSSVPSTKVKGSVFFHSTKGLCQSDGTTWYSIQDGTVVT